MNFKKAEVGSEWYQTSNDKHIKEIDNIDPSGSRQKPQTPGKTYELFGK